MTPRDPGLANHNAPSHSATSPAAARLDSRQFPARTTWNDSGCQSCTPSLRNTRVCRQCWQLLFPSRPYAKKRGCCALEAGPAAVVPGPHPEQYVACNVQRVSARVCRTWRARGGEESLQTGPGSLFSELWRSTHCAPRRWSRLRSVPVGRTHQVEVAEEKRAHSQDGALGAVTPLCRWLSHGLLRAAASRLLAAAACQQRSQCACECAPQAGTACGMLHVRARRHKASASTAAPL